MTPHPIRRVVLVVPFLVAVAVGCGGKTSSSDTPDAAGTIDAAVIDAFVDTIDAPIVPMPDAPPGTPDAPPGTIDAAVVIDAPIPTIDAPIPTIDAATDATLPADAKVDAKPDARPIDAHVFDAPPGCAPVLGMCGEADDCCSGVCDTFTGRCTPEGGCAASGQNCNSPADCCTGTCALGQCTQFGCSENGGDCFQNGDCCTNNCNVNTCEPVSGAECVTLGNTCNLDDQCCSMNCNPDNHTCFNAGGPFGCHATGDICFESEDCCTAQCLILVGETSGTCQDISATGSGDCMVDGEPCDKGENCCSRLCAAVPGGGTICQVASGCRVVGDMCREDDDCCGGPNSMRPGEGNVECILIEETDPVVGQCSNANSCQPEGDTCGKSEVNARNNCCGCDPPKAQCCHQDASGVFRCFGGGGEECPDGLTGEPPCCLDMGEVCSFADQCCNDVPCVPDSSGVLRCATVDCIPPVECQNSSDTCCTATTDCCAGLLCVLSPGELTGECENPNPPPPPPDAGVPDATPPPPDAKVIDAPPKPDAAPGTPDAPPADASVPDARVPDAAPKPDAPPVCSLLGQDCGDSQPCCEGYACSDSMGNDCAPAEAGCTCLTIIP